MNPGLHPASAPASPEWAARVELAACYRLVAKLGLDDLIYNHISMRVPGEREQLGDVLVVRDAGEDRHQAWAAA